MGWQRFPKNLKTPLRDGDDEREDDEVYAGAMFVNANSSNKPGLVDEDLNPILDKSRILLRLLRKGFNQLLRLRLQW